MGNSLQEEVIESKRIYTGRVINLRVDKLRLPHGLVAEREVVEHPGAVAIVALTEDNALLLVRQYRHPAGEVLLEIPAGKLEPGEDPDDSAKRELAEETGYAAEVWEKRGEFFTAPGFAAEKMHLYLARRLHPVGTNFDPDEIIELEKIPLAQARDMVQAARIRDAKTIIGICLCPE